MGRRLAFALTLFAWLASLACGYSFRSAAGRLPDGSRSLRVAVVEDRSTEAGAGAELSEALRNQALRRSLQPGKEEAVLATRLVRVDARPLAVALAAGRYRARQQEVVIRASFVLSLASGERHEFQLQEQASYLSAADLRNTLANKRVALQQAIDRMAEAAIERISRGF